MPTCSNCGQYFISNDLGCPNCSKKQNPSISKSLMIKNISKKLFKNPNIIPNRTYTPIIAPPPPPTPSQGSSQSDTYSPFSTLNFGDTVIAVGGP